MRIQMQANKEKTLKIAFDEFLRLKKVKRVSNETLRYYNECFRYFLEYLEDDVPSVEINQNTILGYLEYLQEKKAGVSDITVNTYLSGIRTILYFCMSQGYTSKFQISLIKAQKPLKETYSDAELEKLLKKPNIKNCSFSEYRNWVIICYLLGTGNRRLTVCNLKISDIDFEMHEVKLQVVKNKKPYKIPISPFLEKTLQEYLTYRKGNPDDYLFCTAYGRQLTPDGLNTCIQKYNISREVTKKGIHLFRHTFAKKWILNKGDPFRLQAILGHGTMDMVKEYVEMFGKDLQKDFEIFNPLDNMECVKKSNGHIKI